MFLWYFFTFAILVNLTSSKCPNSCSSHGFCGVANQCACYPGWTGGAPDCSLRNCPRGSAWADKAYSTDLAHQPAECSNAGECDRSSGICKCFPGFTGSACQRLSCPNECSGHGVCSSLRDISLYLGPDYNSKTERAGDGLGIPYLNWDSDSIQICECDSGYFGADCSLVMCPKGDDPLTINQNFRAIRFEIYAGAPLKGKIGLQFQGTKIYIPYAGLTSQSCSDLLSFSGKFGLVGCTYNHLSGYQINLDLTFYNWPIYPKDNNLYSNNGNPSSFDFFCDISYSNPSTYCQFSDIQAADIIEYSYCSNRGNCDYVTGTCSCYDGFGGPACSNATYLYQADSYSSPGLLVNVKAANFTSSALQIQTTKSPAPDFYLIEAIANSNTLFFVRGDGVVGINKLKTLSGGQTISGGGLFIEEGGCTIGDSGLQVYSSDPTNSVTQIVSKFNGPLSSSYSALLISSASTYSNNFYHINSLNQGKSRFSVRADGAVFVRGGGIQVTSGITILTRGLSVTGGITISDVGMVILQNGLSATGGLTVNSNGIKILSGGVQVYGGASIYSGGMKLASGMTVTSGGLSVTGGLSVNNNGATVSGGLTIFSSGVAITGGATVSNLGLRVLLGGLTVSSGGGYFTGGLTVGGGLAVTGGVQATGGLTVGTSLIVSDSVVSISNGGLVAQGGLSLISGPVSFGNGLTVENHGLRVSGGLTVTNSFLQAGSGIRVTGGLSVLTNGLFSSNGATILGNTIINALTVSSNSLFASGVVSFNGGVVISGGLTVGGTVNLQYSPVYSDRRLKTNLAPISKALDKVSKLRGVYYDWIQNEPTGMIFDKERHIGIIAQEVRKVVPEVVHPSRDNEYLTVDYNSLIPVLIEAIHELEQMIGELKGKQIEAEKNSISFKEEILLLKQTKRILR